MKPLSVLASLPLALLRFELETVEAAAGPPARATFYVWDNDQIAVFVEGVRGAGGYATNHLPGFVGAHIASRCTVAVPIGGARQAVQVGGGAAGVRAAFSWRGELSYAATIRQPAPSAQGRSRALPGPRSRKPAARANSTP